MEWVFFEYECCFADCFLPAADCRCLTSPSALIWDFILHVFTFLASFTSINDLISFQMFRLFSTFSFFQAFEFFFFLVSFFTIPNFFLRFSFKSLKVFPRFSLFEPRNGIELAPRVFSVIVLLTVLATISKNDYGVVRAFHPFTNAPLRKRDRDRVRDRKRVRFKGRRKRQIDRKTERSTRVRGIGN